MIGARFLIGGIATITFAACFAAIHGASNMLLDFTILPEHGYIDRWSTATNPLTSQRLFELATSRTV
jgi:hypothetical protein